MMRDYAIVTSVGLANYTVFVDVNRVNIEDLVRAKPGNIVRVDGPPVDCLIYVADNRTDFDHVAGMISENP
jgi:hypothetical protein